MVLYCFFQDDGSVVVAVADPGEGEKMDVGEKKQPSYRDYVQLWLHVMDPTKLKVCVVCVVWNMQNAV